MHPLQMLAPWAFELMDAKSSLFDWKKGLENMGGHMADLCKPPQPPPRKRGTLGLGEGAAGAACQAVDQWSYALQGAMGAGASDLGRGSTGRCLGVRKARRPKGRHVLLFLNSTLESPDPEPQPTTIALMARPDPAAKTRAFYLPPQLPRPPHVFRTRFRAAGGLEHPDLIPSSHRPVEGLLAGSTSQCSAGMRAKGSKHSIWPWGRG